jgi:hypothetical protein
MGNSLHQRTSKIHNEPLYVSMGKPTSRTAERGPESTIPLNATLYKPIVDEYLQHINISHDHYREDREKSNIGEYICMYRHIYKRDRILQFIWPRCVGIPMLHFDLNKQKQFDWWINVYRPYIDIMLRDVCTEDVTGGVFMLLGWVEYQDEHQTVLHFDIQNQVQTFFDPQGLYDERMRNKVLATGYTTNYRAPIIEYDSIQQIIESRGPWWIPVDTCAAICMLLLVCCRRFGTTDIHGMSDIIRSRPDHTKNRGYHNTTY